VTKDGGAVGEYNNVREGDISSTVILSIHGTYFLVINIIFSVM
jgi:hypothetical protein